MFQEAAVVATAAPENSIQKLLKVHAKYVDLEKPAFKMPVLTVLKDFTVHLVVHVLVENLTTRWEKCIAKFVLLENIALGGNLSARVVQRENIMTTLI